MLRTFAVLTAKHRFSPAAATATPALTARDARMQDAMQVHLPFVWRVLRRFGLSRLEAEDAAREVFTGAAREQGATGRAELEELTRAALAAAEARRRLRGPWALVPANDVVPCELDDAVLSESLLLIDRGLDALAPIDRAIFVLTELEGLSATLVSSVLGMPRSAVTLRRTRARKRFSTAAIRFVRCRSLSGRSAPEKQRARSR